MLRYATGASQVDGLVQERRNSLANDGFDWLVGECSDMLPVLVKSMG